MGNVMKTIIKSIKSSRQQSINEIQVVRSKIYEKMLENGIPQDKAEECISVDITSITGDSFEGSDSDYSRILCEIILLFMFYLFNRDWFWNLYAFLNRYSDYRIFSIMQAISGIIFLYLSVYFSSNVDFVRSFMAKHERIRIVVVTILSIAAAFLFDIIFCFIPIMLAVLADSCDEEYKKKCREDFNNHMEELKTFPRGLSMLFGLIGLGFVLILLAIVLSFFVNDTFFRRVAYLISEVVSFAGLIFAILSAVDFYSQKNWDDKNGKHDDYIDNEE